MIKSIIKQLYHVKSINKQQFKNMLALPQLTSHDKNHNFAAHVILAVDKNL